MPQSWEIFTSPPEEGMLRNFTSVKIQRLRPDLNPRPWVPEASMLTTRPPYMYLGYGSVYCKNHTKHLSTLHDKIWSPLSRQQGAHIITDGISKFKR
jgi:hypothetical protein